MKKGIIVIAVLVASVGFFMFSHSSVSSDSESPRVISLDASRFSYSPNVIHVKKGEYVKIIVHNIDTTHGISIPDFGVSGVDGVEFTADKAGTFEFKCPTMCGEGHRDMKGTLIVE